MQDHIILITGRDKALRRSLKSLLTSRGLSVSDAADPKEVEQTLETSGVDLLVFLHSKENQSLDLKSLEEIRRKNAAIPIILITREGSEDLAVAALKLNISDYLKQPLVLADFWKSVDCCLSSGVSGASRSNRPQTSAVPLDGACIVGESGSIREVKAYIKRVALTDATVLITGETGTGKELVARLIHSHSPRHKSPFVSVNCVAIPDTLLESELFGHERGAFTDAITSKDGLLKTAEGGTVFLDEIGDMTPLAQAKILRAIESREVCRLGGKVKIPLDIRIIAATNQPLEQAVEEGTFRKDLYYRLHVARIHLPPLRERPGDIPLLLNHFLGELNRQSGRAVQGFTEEALKYLVGYTWPGNVRELKNLLEATYINLTGRLIGVADLPRLFRDRLTGAGAPGRSERDHLISVLNDTNWNKSKAAQHLHWSRMTLYRKMEKYKIEGPGPGKKPPLPADCNALHFCNN
jgi:DNA-binding NtrC family response regulator